MASQKNMTNEECKEKLIEIFKQQPLTAEELEMWRKVIHSLPDSMASDVSKSFTVCGPEHTGKFIKYITPSFSAMQAFILQTSDVSEGEARILGMMIRAKCDAFLNLP